ncbi:MAG: MBL fold metallo-hydrolase [Pseudomonadales bacterium]|nr:MBL fold metallo-hydrolase [Pseudomonadales bacterium]
MKHLISTLLLLTAAVTAQADTKLYIFDCGYFKFSDISMFSLDNSETDVREMFVPCYLIEHEKGRLLWDGGLPIEMAGKPKHEDQPGVEVEYKRSVVDQLADLELTPEDIDLASYSHFHYDHVGAANAFSSATLLIQQTEYDAAFLHPETNPVFTPSLYSELANSSKVFLNGDHDVFGDGSVTIISAPGHTPGHQTLLLNLKNTGKIMLSGDLYHFEASRALRRTPTFNTDQAETLRSIDKVEAMLKDTGATLWIEHNKALADTLRKSPEFYD